MSGLSIQDLNKSYGTVSALRDVSLEVSHGQFVCLLGPSGCGKSTLLRILAGLEEPSSGAIFVDGQNITHAPAHLRDFGMVFQSLALFPHLSVGDNIAYPMRIRGIGKAERAREVERLLDLVRLPGVAHRSITQLSGGQRQRVAIARALALRPKLFLLDEPMSALDAKLREAMQIEVKRLQQSLGVTTFLVTHDQREAMTTADIVIVMKGGVVQQIAPPLEIYRSPANAFVADFIGQANLIEGQVTGSGRIRVAETELDIPAAGPAGDAMFSVRPEDLALLPQSGCNTLAGTISFVRHLGASIEVSVRVEGHPRDLVVAVAPQQDAVLDIGRSIHVYIPGASCVVLR